MTVFLRWALLSVVAVLATAGIAYFVAMASVEELPLLPESPAAAEVEFGGLKIGVVDTDRLFTDVYRARCYDVQVRAFHARAKSERDVIAARGRAATQRYLDLRERADRVTGRVRERMLRSAEAAAARARQAEIDKEACVGQRQSELAQMEERYKLICHSEIVRAVESIADIGGYDLIFDRSAAGSRVALPVVLHAEVTDLTGLVRSSLLRRASLGR